MWDDTGYDEPEDDHEDHEGFHCGEYVGEFSPCDDAGGDTPLHERVAAVLADYADIDTRTQDDSEISEDLRRLGVLATSAHTDAYSSDTFQLMMLAMLVDQVSRLMQPRIDTIERRLAEHARGRRGAQLRHYRAEAHTTLAVARAQHEQILAWLLYETRNRTLHPQRAPTSQSGRVRTVPPPPEDDPVFRVTPEHLGREPMSPQVSTSIVEALLPRQSSSPLQRFLAPSRAFRPASLYEDTLRRATLAHCTLSGTPDRSDRERPFRESEPMVYFEDLEDEDDVSNTTAQPCNDRNDSVLFLASAGERPGVAPPGTQAIPRPTPFQHTEGGAKAGATQAAEGGSKAVATTSWEKEHRGKRYRRQRKKKKPSAKAALSADTGAEEAGDNTEQQPVDSQAPWGPDL